MTALSRFLGLLPLIVATGLNASGSPQIVRHDTFTGDLRENWWTSSGMFMTLYDFDTRLVLLRDPLNPAADQHHALISSFSRSENAHQFTIQIAIRMPRRLVAPETDADDAVSIGIGFLANNTDHQFVEFALEDSLAGRHLVRRFSAGDGLRTVKLPLEHGVGNRLELRIFRRQRDGNLAFTYREPDKPWQTAFGQLSTPEFTGRPPPSTLRPFIVGRILGNPQRKWDLSADNFRLFYRREPN